jgi:hypothetical protein
MTPTGALGRSWRSPGIAVAMLGLLVTPIILLYIPLVSLSGIAAVVLPMSDLTAPRGGGAGLVAVGLAGVVQLLIYPLFYCVLTVAYYDLRVRKEGFDLEVLASTLQPA